MRDWQDARIRKVVRRARGAEWRRAEALPGITVTGKSAEVRVFPPVPLDGWPKDLARLQVSGTDLDDPEPPLGPDPAVPVLWLNPELDMSAGKAMAQAGTRRPARVVGAVGRGLATLWRDAGFPLVRPHAGAGPVARTHLRRAARGPRRGFHGDRARFGTVVADHPCPGPHRVQTSSLHPRVPARTF